MRVRLVDVVRCCFESFAFAFAFAFALQRIMSREEDSLEKLDSEFDHYLVDMKPFVLRLPDKSGEFSC